jgi:hypothetical protein
VNGLTFVAVAVGAARAAGCAGGFGFGMNGRFAEFGTNTFTGGTTTGSVIFVFPFLETKKNPAEAGFNVNQ